MGKQKNKTMKKLFSVLVLGLSISFYSCKKDSVDHYGCINENAENFNPAATNSDGSCEFSTTYLMSGDWNITYLEYETELDLSAFNYGVLPIVGESADAGTFSMSLEDNTYVSELDFVTSPITLPIIGETPGIQVNLPSDGIWSISDDEEMAFFVENTTGVVQEYEIVKLTEDFLDLRGSVDFVQNFAIIGDLDLQIELDLTLEK